MTLERPDNLVLVAALPEKPDSTVVDSCQFECDQDLYCAEFHHFVPSVLTPITSTTLADVVWSFAQRLLDIQLPQTHWKS